MAKLIIPNMPDVSGVTVSKDRQLWDLLIAIRTTIEKITGATPAELDELLEKNE
jgi:hypothetical protein